MDVLDRCIHHAAGATRLGVEGRLEERAENRRTYPAPVETGRAVEKTRNLFGHGRNFRFARACEESAVRVGEYCKFRFKIAVALFRRRIERLEEPQKLSAQELHGRRLDEIAESVLRENVGIFGIQAEH